MISYWKPLSNIESVDDRITRIFDLIKKAYDLTIFDDQTDISEKFWRLALTDSSGSLDESRWDRFSKIDSLDTRGTSSFTSSFRTETVRVKMVGRQFRARL
jgi:hypothetical protein